MASDDTGGETSLADDTFYLEPPTYDQVSILQYWELPIPKSKAEAARVLDREVERRKAERAATTTTAVVAPPETDSYEDPYDPLWILPF